MLLTVVAPEKVSEMGWRVVQPALPEPVSALARVPVAVQELVQAQPGQRAFAPR